MTQKEVVDLVGISLRSYKSYENDEEKRRTMEMLYLVQSPWEKEWFMTVK